MLAADGVQDEELHRLLTTAADQSRAVAGMAEPERRQWLADNIERMGKK